MRKFIKDFMGTIMTILILTLMFAGMITLIMGIIKLCIFIWTV